ncbi:Proline dehydrogenase [Actinidia chinensis var. chinensis]|uniref:Proline dehydrogenase n=1 Tax=Actinidia chinensis var. chinensis TaxID=1590841 RepID=A0A2R6P9V3_ACTCC|nr:Proline dehydrogenase [Actinidia chinensis var. chinensis]
MAHRVLCPKILQSLRNSTTTPLLRTSTTTLYSAAVPPPLTVSPLSLHETPDPDPITPTPLSSPTTTILNLNDVKELFSSVPTLKLLRSAANLHVAAIEPMVDLGIWVMNSKLMTAPVAREVTVGAIKHTFYEHFCAGRGPVEAARTAAKLWDSGLKGMLVYALEHAADNESCDWNLDAFLKTVESIKSLATCSVSSTVVKITAICPLRLLRRVSDLLRWEYNNNQSFQLPWKLNTLPVFSDSSPFYHTPIKPDPLTPEEESDLHFAQQRMLKLCQKCVEVGVPLLVDAEDTSVQPGIDYFTYSAALMHNKGDNPIIYGTIQTYLKDARERLFLAAREAERMGVPIGVKLVRGAYMSSERELAASLGVESPIHNTIHQTHACFNDCASFMLEKIANGSGAVVLATHNIDSGNKAAAKATDLGIKKGNEKLQFAQLYGMADALSFGLRNVGFQVSKYMPFGPVERIMPYLLRRAEENRGLLCASTLDRQLLRKELMRRLKVTIF